MRKSHALNDEERREKSSDSPLLAMTKSSILTQTNLDDLLQWLCTDRESAGQKYEHVRRTLIRVFAGRKCYHAEELADETLTRVANKARTLAVTYEGDRFLYFYGVAKNVYHEYLKRLARESASDESQMRNGRGLIAQTAAEESDESDARLECLLNCLRSLPDEQREIVTKYYDEQKSANINNRKALAERYRLSMNALRLKASRLRKLLRQCVLECMANGI